MTIAIGTQVGSYQITALLGEGGMGRVFRAHDTNLKRDVAIKILPEEFSRDADRLARFQREAETLASINHTNIAGIHDLAEIDGSRFLVLELVEGETLAERIARGPIPFDEALDIAKQIAEALEAAHERGIVHRDLKPANIKIAPDGKVKVLDFGLAKMWKAGQSPSTSNSPTMMGATTPGMIMGTAAYMSPEQARGKTVDRSADIWAFACVLYEMLTGRKTFDGETITDILGAIVRAEPDWNVLPRTVPPHVRRLLRRCLEKDRRRRLRDAGAVFLELHEKRDETAPASIIKSNRERWAWIAAVAILAAALTVVFVLWRRPIPTALEMRVQINTPPTTDETSLAISPDGQKIVFVATSDNQPRLWLRSLDSVTARPLTGTDGALFPFWSPDSRSIAFFADGKLKRIDITGGSAQTLTETPPGRGGTWNRAGVIVFAPTQGPLFRVSETGGESTTVTHVEAPQQLNHRFPQFLPDGRHFLFYVRGAPEAQGVYAASLDGSSMRRLLDADAAAVYSLGHLFFVRQATLFAQMFDPDRLELAGKAFPVAEQVAFDDLAAAAFSVSAAGPLVYRTGGAGGQRQLVWFDRSGKEIRKVGDPDNAAPLHPELSPDGRHVSIRRTVNGNADIWLLETARGVLSPFTFDGAIEDYPVWSPDSRQIVFQSNRKGAFDLYQKPASGEGREELLLTTPNYKSPADWSSDGRFVLYRVPEPKTGYDIWALRMDGDKKPFPVIQTNSEERDGQFSPDGRWVAYQSNEPGRFEIYVQTFPIPAGKARISTNGGAQVRWRRDARELFYIALDGQLMAVPIRLDSKSRTVDAGTPVALFRTRIVGGAVQGVNRQQYVVSLDGQRFLINSYLEEATTSPITVILNWKPTASSNPR